MPAKKLIDYYKLLAIPPDADLIGIENAYVRLSDELVQQAVDDPGTEAALTRLNEAFAVLANAESRRKYDRMLFAAEYAALERRLQADARRRWIARQIIVGVLLLMVLAQAAVLTYIGWDTVSDVLSVVLGPLSPSTAG